MVIFYHVSSEQHNNCFTLCVKCQSYFICGLLLDVFLIKSHRKLPQSTLPDRPTSVFPQSLLYKWVMRTVVVGGGEGGCHLAVHGCQNSARGAADLLALPFHCTVRACFGQMEA